MQENTVRYPPGTSMADHVPLPKALVLLCTFCLHVPGSLTLPGIEMVKGSPCLLACLLAFKIYPFI